MNQIGKHPDEIFNRTDKNIIKDIQRTQSQIKSKKRELKRLQSELRAKRGLDTPAKANSKKEHTILSKVLSVVKEPTVWAKKAPSLLKRIVKIFKNKVVTHE